MKPKHFLIVKLPRPHPARRYGRSFCYDPESAERASYSFSADLDVLFAVQALVHPLSLRYSNYFFPFLTFFSLTFSISAFSFGFAFGFSRPLNLSLFAFHAGKTTSFLNGLFSVSVNGDVVLS